MARRSEKLESLSALRKEELIADIMRGELTWRALSAKFDVPLATLKAFADRNQIQRNPTGAKREMVAAKLAQPYSEQPSEQPSEQFGGITEQRSDSLAKSSLEAAADEDVRDMRYALQCARMALNIAGKKLSVGLRSPEQLSPRDLKSLNESLVMSTDTIRSIRGLDAPPPDMSGYTDEELDAVIAGKK